MYFSAVGTMAGKYAVIVMTPKGCGMDKKGEFPKVEFILVSVSLEENFILNCN